MSLAKLLGHIEIHNFWIIKIYRSHWNFLCLSSFVSGLPLCSHLQCLAENSFLQLYNLFSYITARGPTLYPWTTFYSNDWLIDWILIDWLHVVLRPIQAYFALIRASPSPANSCEIYRPNSDHLASGFLACDGRRRGDPNDTGVCSALTAFESEGVFNVPHLLWHGVSISRVSSEELTHLVA